MSGLDRNRQYIIVSLIFLALFLVSATIYARYRIKLDRRNLANHARIITDDVWAINPAGVENYLRLAMETQHYKSIRVSIPGDEDFIHLENEELTGISGLFHRLGLIPTKQLHETITHKGLDIGSLHAVQYVRIIFGFFNLLGVHLLLLLLSLSILFLADRRRTLEILVRERTRNLLESQRRFHDLVNLLPEMVLETDLHGNILYANNEARKRFGLGHESDEAPNLFNYFPPEQRKQESQQFRNRLETSALYQQVLHDRDHRPFPVLIRCAPISKHGEFVGARLLLIDITERQRLEEQLKQDQKMKAIGLMAGGVAHDLNNILSGIVSYPEALLLDLEMDSPLRKPLSIMRKAGLEASEVVADLLTVARGSRGDTEVVAPNRLIREYLDSPDFEEMRSRFPLVDYRLELAPDLLNLTCSPIHIRKCLMNLVGNGFEAIEGKGLVTISTSNVYPEELDRREIPLPRDQEYFKISVGDNGTGIGPRELEHIFEPFYSKKVMGRSGTGLGLTVVWNTVRDHGGTVKVTSSSHGTLFELYLPGTRTVVAKEQGTTLQIQRGDGESILVIDDEPRQREIASTLLRSLGYTVETVATGEEAWSYLRKNRVDLVVLDMLMGPDQPNGREIYREILSFRPGQKAIIASGFAEDEDVRQTLAMGAQAFVPKPYTITAISSAVYTTLHPRSS